jgi:hypothetical protein
MYKTILFLILFTLSANATIYDVKFKGIKLGEIENLETLENTYLKAKVTNSIARFMLGKKYLIFYGDEKPNLKGVKFKKDNKMILYSFYQSLKSRPKHQVYKINDIKNITLECEGNSCEFTYKKNNHIDGKGTILFDKDGEFISINEEFSSVVISRK